MTEAEWLKCPAMSLMCSHLRLEKRINYTESGRRKFRLLACQCCRRVWSVIKDARLRRAVELSERYADKRASKSDLGKAWATAKATARELAEQYLRRDIDDPAASIALGRAQAAQAVVATASPDQIATRAESAAYEASEVMRSVADEADDDADAAERRLQSDYVRDIFGNPFRPVTFSPAWRTDTAVTLARQMYDSREFGAMPILADALQDAGCDNEDVLAHCRDTGATHVRGCWVVDLVLGKE